MTSKLVQGNSDIPPKPLCNVVKGHGGTKGPFLIYRNDRPLLRDNFMTSTWLLIGATLETSLLLLPVRPPYASAPAVILLSYRFINNILICFSLKHSPSTDGVTIWQSVPPSTHPPTYREICVLLLTARCN
jgi:hypothetical protein